MIKDILTTAISKYLSFALNLAIGVIIARAFGAEGKGFVFAALLIPQLIAVYGSLSVNEGFLYYLASKKLNKNSYYNFILKTIVFHLPILLISYTIYFLIFDDTSIKGYIFSLFYIPALFVVEIFRYSLRGLMQINKYNLSLLIEGVAKLIFVLFVMFFDLGIYWVIVSHGLCVFVAIVYMLKIVDFSDCSHDSVSLKEVYNYGLKVHLFRTLNVTESKFDVYLISILLPLYDLGLYSVAVSFSLILMTLVQNPISTVILPEIARMDFSLRAEFVARVTSFMIYFGCIFGLFSYFVGEWVLDFIYGPEFVGAFWPMIILLFGALLKTPMATINCYFKACGKPGIISRVSLISAPLNVLFCVILIPKYGIYGAAASSSATYFLFSAILTFYFLRDSNVKIGKFFTCNPFIILKKLALR